MYHYFDISTLNLYKTTITNCRKYNTNYDTYENSNKNETFLIQFIMIILKCKTKLCLGVCPNEEIDN